MGNGVNLAGFSGCLLQVLAPSLRVPGLAGSPEASGASTAHGSLNGVAVGFPQHPGRVLR